jgi:hypothetical protein
LKHSPELQCELQSQHSRLRVALPVQVARLVRARVLAQVAQLALARVQVVRLVQVLARVARSALALVWALAEHLPRLLLRQLQSRCQLELCRLL